MIIYNRNGVELMRVTPNSNSVRKCDLMADNFVQIEFDHAEFSRIPARSYIIHRGERFWLLGDYQPKDTDKGYSYQLKFVGIQGLFSTILFYYRNSQGGKEYDFELSATLPIVAGELIRSIREQLPDLNITLGDLKANTELKDLKFSGVYVSEALNYIADQFETEHWMFGTELNISRAEYGIVEELTVGTELKADIEIQEGAIKPQYLKSYGGTKNIKSVNDGTVTYGSRLQLPTGIDHVEVPGVTTDITQIRFYDDIYPSVVGTVTEVKYNRDDKSPIYYIKDQNRGFDLEEVRVEGLVPRIRFTSGRLNGREFDIDDVVDKDSPYFEFTEIFREEQEGVYLPRPGLSPNAGDTYIIYNISLPESEKDKASQRLLTKTQEDATKIAASSPDVTCSTNPVFYAEDNFLPSIGQKLKINYDLIPGGSITSRLTGFEYPLDGPEEVKLVLKDAITPGRLSQIEKDVANITSGLTEIGIEEHSHDKLYVSLTKDQVVEGKKSFKDDIKSTNYTGSSLTDSGWKAGKNEFGESIVVADKAVFRKSLEVPDIIFNRVRVVGDEMWVTEGGEIEDVLLDGDPTDNRYRVLLKEVAEGGICPLAQDDILRGMVSVRNEETNLWSGFYTVELRVTDIMPDQTFLCVPRFADKKPVKGVDLARIGNFTNKERQRSILLSARSGNIRILEGVDTWDFSWNNTGLQLGDMSDAPIVIPPDIEELVGGIGGYNGYMEKVFAKSVITISNDGKTAKPIPVYKGNWSSSEAPYFYYDEVTHRGRRYLMIGTSKNGTMQEPRYDSTDWLQTEGAEALVVELESSRGVIFTGQQDLYTTVTARVMDGTEIVEGVENAQVSWFRNSTDINGDLVWNNAHQGIGLVLYISWSNGDFIDTNAHTFTCVVTVNVAGEVKKFSNMFKIF